jgi:Ni/Co efflux regulator RcnB
MVKWLLLLMLPAAMAGTAMAQAQERAGDGEPSVRHRSAVQHRRHRAHQTHPRRINARKAAQRQGWKAVSSLVNFPSFFPSLGIIYVKPDTLPLGPFLAFDREDRRVATIYMVPLADMNAHKKLEAGGFAGSGDHTTFYFNAGHPGVDVPHYHIVIWHVPKSAEARLSH